MQELDYSLAPSGWAICFQNDCPLKDTCLRYAIGTVVPETVTHHTTVLPAARKGDRCQLFASKEPVRIARGMMSILDGIKPYIAQEIREQLFDIFGSRRHFYRYRKGEYIITPRQQELVAQLFCRFGIQYEVPYDHVSQGYYFPSTIPDTDVS